jgi:hypothetical protein
MMMKSNYRHPQQRRQQQQESTSAGSVIPGSLFSSQRMYNTMAFGQNISSLPPPLIDQYPTCAFFMPLFFFVCILIKLYMIVLIIIRKADLFLKKISHTV